MPGPHSRPGAATVPGVAVRSDLPSQDARLYRVVADRIRRIIRQASIPAGARLPSERAMSAQLDVSRQSIREALIELELRGEIEVRNGSGAYVTASAAAEARVAGPIPRPFEVLAARRLIEPEVAAQAARVATDQAIDIVLGAAAGVEGNANKQADRDFHLAIALAAGNSALYGVLAQLWDQHATLHDHADGQDRAALADHRAVASAIAARDPSAARHAMRWHLDRLTRTLSTRAK